MAKRARAAAQEEAIEPAPGVSVASNGSEMEKDNFALHLLLKMGWRAGSGLGRDESGLAAPLVHEQTSSKTGVIKQAEEMQLPRVVRPACSSSRSILLLNMVSADEVDDDLQEEVLDEASKFGNLIDVQVTVNKQAVNEKDQVEILCQYESVQDASKALHEFNGRFFGGRIVEAIYHPT